MAGRKGRSGKRPTPVSLLKLTGGYRQDRHGQNKEMDLPATIPAAPKFLKGAAIEKWNKLTGLLAKAKCVTELDEDVLASYCQEYKKYVEANSKLDSLAMMLSKTSKNTISVSALVRLSDRALNNMVRLFQEIGLSPAARRTLRLVTKSEISDDKSRFFTKEKE